MKKILIIFVCLFILPKDSFGLQALLKAGREELLFKGFYKFSRHSPAKKRFFSNTPFNGQIPVSEIKKETVQLSSHNDAHLSILEKEKFSDDMIKYDQKVLHNEAIKEKDWAKNLQEGWHDFTKEAKKNPELTSEEFFDDLMKSDQAAKKEDRAEIIRDLAGKMVIKGIDPKDISEITGLSEEDVLSLKSKE